MRSLFKNIFLGCCFTSSVFAEHPVLTSLRNNFVPSIPFQTQVLTYQIGSTWGKERVTAETWSTHSAAYKQGALQTFKLYLNSKHKATAVYLGKFQGEHVVATNFHVFANEQETICKNSFLETFFLGSPLFLSCKESLGLWPEIDLALFTVNVPVAKEPLLNGVGHNFAFHKALYAGQPLRTIGFGVAANPSHFMMANQDAECFVFSSQLRYMADPDELHNSAYKVWSFASGCDISHGDSGSAMFDRGTGDIVGILWTGRIPKNAKVRDNDYLNQIFQSQSEDIWTELTYAVPVSAIEIVLRRTLEEQQTSEAHKAILSKLLP